MRILGSSRGIANIPRSSSMLSTVAGYCLRLYHKVSHVRSVVLTWYVRVVDLAESNLAMASEPGMTLMLVLQRRGVPTREDS